MESYFGDVWLVRFLIQRGLAALYLIAFIVVLQQFKPLLGERGLLPVPLFLKHTSVRETPSLFMWRYSDRLLNAVAWTGLVLSAVALSGVSEHAPVWLSVPTWLILWVLYLSIVNVGQTFYAFGWESMLLEAGFFATFMGPSRTAPSLVPILILRWMLFRTELGAGLIKLRHDRCWRELTCLFYHYETQPLPNPLSWYFHHLPKFMHRWSVLFSHLVQLIVPLRVIPVTALGTVPRPPLLNGLLYAIGGATVVLSIRPVLNLFSKNQLMNYSYNRFHLVNTYGAFGRVTRERYEIVIEGTDEPVITHQTRWQEYEFKAKPGNPRRMPPQIAPYHLRLDWLMWFLPFSVIVAEEKIQVSGYEIWFLRLIQKLLENDAQTLKLFRHNPFESKRPTFIRAGFYLYRYRDWDKRNDYRYRDWDKRNETGTWWVRRLVDIYLPPVSLSALRAVSEAHITAPP